MFKKGLLISSIVFLLLFGSSQAFAQTPIPTLPVGPNTFFDNFNVSPKNPDGTFKLDPPQLFGTSSTWDIRRNKRGENSSGTLGPAGGMDQMAAGHGADCTPYPATHSINKLIEATYTCRDHIMTAINAGDYGALVFTPGAIIDFTNGPATIRFDISTLRTSTRDWWDVNIAPFDAAVPMPIHWWLPEGYGTPNNSVMFESRDRSIVNAVVMRNGTEEDHSGAWYTGYDTFLTPSAVRRDTVELTISKTHIKSCMPGYNFCWVDEDISPLPFTKGVVQFGHHSYTPFKDGNGGPNTWHWDNVHISPSTPFTIIPTNESPYNYILAGNPNVSFSKPAPTNSLLRVNLKGKAAEASFDNGTTWTVMTRIPTNKGDSSTVLRPYKVNVPTGATSVRFRAQVEQWEGRWEMRDVQVWSLTASASTPTNTPTPAVATPTPTRTPTPTTAQNPSPTPRKLGDVDGDGTVGIFDFNELQSQFGMRQTNPFLSADLDKDGEVGITDYNEVLANFQVN